jgi:hypothetical protein
MHRLLLPSALAMLALPALAHSRLVPDWPYEKLLKEADVVVIGKAVTSKDTKDVSKDNPWKVEFQAVETTFSVEAGLKGKVEGDKLTVLHYKLKPGVSVENGPGLVTFRTKGITLRTKEAKVGLGQPGYLLFLKKGKDGRYEPVSGQVDPELSVKELNSPLPDTLWKGESD